MNRLPPPTPIEKAQHPVGPANDAAILAVTEGRRIIAAWGASVERYAPGRVAHVLQMLEGRKTECLGLTADGSPRHPLYVPKLAKPQVFREA